MKLLLDSHTHTLASGHAYSTIKEMTESAEKKGLKLLSITEHGPLMPNTCQEYYFQNLKVLPRKHGDMIVLFGAETNIIDYEGTLDMSHRLMEGLDIIIASLHVPCLKPGTKEENTRAYLGAMKNPRVAIIGHPDDSRYPIDYEQLVLAAKEHKVLLELNNSSLTPHSFRMNARENYLQMLSLCKEHQVPIIVDSDAHAEYDIGNFDLALSLLKETEFPHCLVVNTSLELFETFRCRKL